MSRGGPQPEPGGRCLVVGGGLIGAHLAEELAAGGARVSVYSRSFLPMLARLAEGEAAVELVAGELPGGAELDELVDAVDVTFMVAGSSTPALAQADVLASVRGSLEPGLAVLDAARRCGTSRVVIASSGGTVYGQVTTTPTPESAPLRPISLHGVNSLALEAYAALYGRMHGLEPIVLRYSNVYGPGQRARRGQGVIAAWTAALRSGEPIDLIGDDSARRDFIYASDAARATVAAAYGAERPGIYNVGSGESHSLARILELLAEVSGLTPDVRRRESRGVDVPLTELDSRLLREQTGWRPDVEISDGIARTWRWLLEDSPRGAPEALEKGERG